jgi:glycosyltransferase involved in cell wall biosynthesis
VPLHNEQENLSPLAAEIHHALLPLARAYELVLVDDGSTDATGDLLDRLAAEDAAVRPVHLDGNFGQAGALCAGFQHARGDILLTLDGDLQNDPADLPRLLQLLESGGYRVVSGWRTRRAEAFTRRVLPSRIANRLIAAITGLPAHDNGCSLKAYRREVVEGKCLPAGLHRFVPAIFGVRPDEFAEVEVAHRARAAGRSHYGLARVFSVLRDLMVVPLILWHPRRARAAATVAVGLGGGLALLALLGRPHGLNALLGGVDLTGVLAALSVRARLDDWIAAQETPPFRIRGANEAPSSGRAGLEWPTPGRERAGA